MQKTIYILFALIFNVNLLLAKPVSLTVSLSPPYTPFLNEYASGGLSKLQVSLIVNDSRLVNHPVKLQMFVEQIGRGVVMQTNLAAVPPIFITGNVTEVFNGADLFRYFQAQNNVFSGFSQSQYLQTGRIPDGYYRIGFTVVDAQRSEVQFSNTTYTQPGWFVLNDPPQLNQPRNKSTYRVVEPQSLLLEWFPRHLGSMNSAFSVSYKVEIFTIRVPNMEPNQVAMSLQPDYTETTTINRLRITPDKFMFEPGVKYAWRVQAISSGNEITLFQNNGYSEVYSFDYGVLCPVPENVNASEFEATSATIHWNTDPIQTGYELRLRRKGDTETGWYTQESFTSQVELTDILLAATQYEYQVKAKCTTVESDYSPLKTFRTPLPPEGKMECGKIDNLNVTNKNPKGELFQGEIIFYGKFPIRLTEISGGGGTFTGKGYMKVPLFMNAKVNMQFTNIKVNELNEVYEGTLVSVYNPNSAFLIDDVTDFFNSGTQVGNINSGKASTAITLGYPLTEGAKLNVKYTGNTITLYDNNTPLETVDVSSTTGGTTISDSEGNIYVADISGDVKKIATTVQNDSGNDSTSGSSYGGMQSPGGFASLSSSSLDDDIQLTFYQKKDDLWAFDTWLDKYEGISPFDSKYEELNGYKVPWKLIPTGKWGKVTAKVTQGKVDHSKVKFRTPVGAEYKSDYSGGKFELTLVSGEHGDGQEIYAVYQVNDTTTKTIGKLKVASYDMISRDIKLVPIGSVSVNETGIEKELNNIYRPYGIELKVTKDSPFTETAWARADGKLDASNTSFCSMYSAEMKALNNAYRSSRTVNEKEMYVFFFDNEAIGAKEGKLAGDMPISSQFGYVFNPADAKKASITIAHELGHGLFQLKHTFDEQYDMPKMSTGNLMDYNNGTHLCKMQWDNIYDPQKLLFPWLQDIEDGQYIDPSNLILDVVDTGEEIDPNTFIYTCYTPAGKLITIANEVKSLNFTTRHKDKIPDGALTGFTNKQGNFVAVYNLKENRFGGYALMVNNSATTVKGKITDNNGKITFYEDELTFKGTASRVYIGYRGNCSINVHTQLFSEASGKPSQKHKGDGTIAPIDGLKFDNTAPYDKIDDDDACELPSLNITALELQENAKQALFNPYGKSGLLLKLKVDGKIQYIYQNVDQEAKNYYYRWDEHKNIWKDWTPQTPQELKQIDVFIAIYEICVYLLVENPHEFLDGIGMVPVFGEVADAINGIWYFIEGNNIDAGLSLISIIPLGGDYIGKSIKYARKIGKIKKVVDLSGETAEKFALIAQKLKAANVPHLEDNLLEIGVLLTKYPDKAADFARLVDKIPDPETLGKVIKKINGLSDTKKAKFLVDIRLVDNVSGNALANNLDQIDDALIDNWKLLNDAEVDNSIRNNIEALSDPDAVADAVQASGKTRPSWPQIMALFKRGNDFNRKGRIKYGDRQSEIVLETKKRLDAYIPGEKIISRKATDIDNITESTWRNYCNELVSKYKVGTPVNSTKMPGEPPLSGKYCLEIPASNQSAKKLEEFRKIAKEYGKDNGGIEIIFLAE